MDKKIKILNDEENNNDFGINFYDDFLKIKNEITRDNSAKKSKTSIPTYTPKTFLEQFVFYNDGTNKRLYIYLSGDGWRYVSLT